MYIDPWQWFRDFQWQAITHERVPDLRLPTIYHNGWRHLESAQYRDALDVFSSGITLAHEMDLPMWVFFFESWVCEVHVLASDYTSALDTTTRLVAKSSKSEHKDHPIRAAVYFTLAWVYFYIDMHGYRDAILSALDALENDMPLDEETHHRSIFLRSEIAFEQEQYDKALDMSDRYMTLVDGNAYREASGYGMQRAVAFVRGDLQTALVANQLREDASREANLLNNAVNCVMWEGVFQQYLGNEAEAVSAIERGKAEYDSLNLPKQIGYYHILAEYHTAQQSYDLALEMRLKQNTVAQENGSLNNHFYCLLDTIYLMNRMTQDATAILSDAETIAKQSKSPDFLLTKLQLAKDGRIARFDWQL